MIHHVFKFVSFRVKIYIEYILHQSYDFLYNLTYLYFIYGASLYIVVSFYFHNLKLGLQNYALNHELMPNNRIFDRLDTCLTFNIHEGGHIRTTTRAKLAIAGQL